MDRRNFNLGMIGAVAGSLAAPGLAAAAKGASRTALYSSTGARLTHYDLDVAAATLTKREVTTLPSAIQYAWPHPSNRYLYASTSDAVSGGRTPTGNVHRLCALRIGPDGALSLNGEPQVLAQRPIHNSIDRSGRFALTAYNTQPDATVHAIGRDGTLGAAIAQDGKLDVGIFPHQIRAAPGNRLVAVVSRGNNANAERGEEPGAIKLFRFARDGKLTPLQSVAAGGKGGMGFGARHLDFHPTKPWVFVSLERQNQLAMFRMSGDSLGADAAFVKATIAPGDKGLPQVLGTVHVHPQGHTVYTANRASGTVDVTGMPLWRGGENSIAVFSIDPQTGEPVLVQSIDTQGFHARTFTIDPSGQLLIAANMTAMNLREGNTIRRVPANLALFRIAADGKLSFERKYDVDLAPGEQQLWAQAIALPA